MDNYSEQIRIYLSMYQSAIERNCEMQRHLDDRDVELRKVLNDLEYLYQYVPEDLRKKYRNASSFVKAHRSQDDVDYFTLDDDLDF